MQNNLRRNVRIPYIGPVDASWDDGREIRYARGRSVDVSEGGLKLDLPVFFPHGVTISLHLGRLNIRGMARVRHAVRRGSKFLIGVELSQPLKAAALSLLQPDRDG